jgi:hypothetical protein
MGQDMLFFLNYFLPGLRYNGGVGFDIETEDGGQRRISGGERQGKSQHRGKANR